MGSPRHPAMLQCETSNVSDPVTVGAQHKMSNACSAQSSCGALALETRSNGIPSSHLAVRRVELTNLAGLGVLQ